MNILLQEENVKTNLLTHMSRHIQACHLALDERDTEIPHADYTVDASR